MMGMWARRVGRCNFECVIEKRRKGERRGIELGRRVV
jgi:hypothetical protein